MPIEKKLTGYPSIDKPWLKHCSYEAIDGGVIPRALGYPYPEAIEVLD